MTYLPHLLEDPSIAESLAFVGFHSYHATPEVGEVVEYVRTRRPDLPVIITEYTSFIYGDLDFGQEASDDVGFMLHALDTALAHYRSGADAALYWDAVDYLQPGRNSLTRWGLLRGPYEGFAPRVWYYGFRQVLPYFVPESRVLDSWQASPDDEPADLTSLALRLPTGDTALFLINRGVDPLDATVALVGAKDTEEMEFSLVRTDQDLRAEWIGRLQMAQGAGQLRLPGRSITTLSTAGRVPPSPTELEQVLHEDPGLLERLPLP
jgi:hypothetical protein